MSDVVIEVVADIEILIEVIEVVIKVVLVVATEVTEHYFVLLIYCKHPEHFTKALSIPSDKITQHSLTHYSYK